MHQNENKDENETEQEYIYLIPSIGVDNSLFTPLHQPTMIYYNII